MHTLIISIIFDTSINKQTRKIMKTNIETLQEAVEAGLKIKAVYIPNGEVVEVLENPNQSSTRSYVKFQDGSEDEVDQNDLIDYTW